MTGKLERKAAWAVRVRRMWDVLPPGVIVGTAGHQLVQRSRDQRPWLSKTMSLRPFGGWLSRQSALKGGRGMPLMEGTCSHQLR